ncbi:MAG: hypothetical protein L6265_07260 [Thermoplasmatales archaeon]|nr:hypothetical protein [Thermoplasmatales archaeon]
MSGEKEKRGGLLMQPSIFFLEPKGVLSFHKRKKGVKERKSMTCESKRKKEGLLMQSLKISQSMTKKSRCVGRG